MHIADMAIVFDLTAFAEAVLQSRAFEEGEPHEGLRAIADYERQAIKLNPERGRWQRLLQSLTPRRRPSTASGSVGDTRRDGVPSEPDRCQGLYGAGNAKNALECGPADAIADYSQAIALN